MNHTNLNKTDNSSTNNTNINKSLNIYKKIYRNQKLTNNIFKNLSQNNIYKNKISIKQNTTSLIHNYNNNNNNIYTIKNYNSSASNTYDILNKRKNNSVDENKTKIKLHKDPVISFFNRDFYCCEIPIPKKLADKQKILDYYLKDKENKEKYKQLLKEKKYGNYNNRIKNRSLDKNSKKYDIKDSLLLNDFRIYNRIHQVIRFWSKFLNYACPIFQVQKFTINSQKYHKNEGGNIGSSSVDNLNRSCFNDKNIKLPKLYTNSSKIFNNWKISGNKFLRRNRSTLDSNNLKNINFMKKL